MKALIWHTFTVDVFFTNDTLPADGTDPVADGKTHGQRRTVSGPSLALDLTSLDSNIPGGDCTITTFGTPTAQFALTTYKNKKTEEFTFVQGSFFNFDAGTGVNYALAFRPGSIVEPVVDSGAGWPPSEATTRVTGDLVRLTAQKGSNADDPCNVDIGIVWIFDVTTN